MLFYLSDLALRDYAKYSQQAEQSINKLYHSLTSFRDLCRHQISNNIKRLKHYQPTVWRYRYDDFRLVFTVTSEPEEIVLIHRFLPRAIVYSQLPKYLANQPAQQLYIEEDINNIQQNREYQFHNRYFNLPLKNLQKSKDITKYITTGNYLFSPCLTEEQLEFVANINHYQFKIYQIQGSAGTGKTTLAFQIASEALKSSNCYPLIVVPTDSLQYFGVKSIEAKAKELKKKINICTNLSSPESSDLAIVTVENFFKFISGDKQDCLSKFEANRIINKYINREYTKYLHGIDLYNLHLGLRQTDGYIQTHKGKISQSYQQALLELNNYYDRENLNKAFDFAGRDLISQAKRAFHNKEKALNNLQNIVSHKDIMFVIDEVQDLYWQQMQSLLWLGQNFKQPFIMLGDVNQEITISGFHWSNFDQNYLQEFVINKHTSLTEKEQGQLLRQHREKFGDKTPLKNFRNTIKIASAARFILIDAFKQFLPENGKHTLDPGEPEEICFEEGVSPLLIKVNEAWLENFLDKLIRENQQDNSSKFVFIINQESEQYGLIKEKIKLYKKQILSLTITQAKGQEFDAVIYISLFAFQKSQPTIHEIYKWYTALTRARHFSVILLLENEYQWLTEQVDSQQISQYFNYLENPNLEILVQAISQQGINIVTTQQILQKIATIYGESWSNWLQGEPLNINLITECQEEDISFWQLINYLENNAQELVNIDYEKITDFQLKNLSTDIFLPDSFACLIMILKIAKDNQILIQLSEKLFINLQLYLQKKPQQLETALKQVETPIAKCLLLRCARKSWQAADLAYKNGYTFLITEIVEDLEKSNLVYESVRMKYQYLDIEPNNKLPFMEVIKKSGDLVNLILEASLEKISKINIL